MSLVRYWADNFTQTRFCQLSGKLPHRTHAIFHYFPTVLWSRSIYIFPKEDLANAAWSFREWNILIHDSIVTNGRDRWRRKKLKCQYVSEGAIKALHFCSWTALGIKVRRARSIHLPIICFEPRPYLVCHVIINKNNDKRKKTRKTLGPGGSSLNWYIILCRKTKFHFRKFVACAWWNVGYLIETIILL